VLVIISLSHLFLFQRGNSLESMILRDRLYRSRESPGCLAALGSAPEFPFSLVQVNKAPVGTAATSRGTQRRQQQQSYASQQQTYTGQQQTYTSQQPASYNAAASQSQAAYGTQQQAQPVSANLYFGLFVVSSLDTCLCPICYLCCIVSPLRTKLCRTVGSRYRIHPVAERIMQTKPPVSRRGRCLNQWLWLQRLQSRLLLSLVTRT